MSVFSDQKKFMEACGQTVNVKNASQRNLYFALVVEELDELRSSTSEVEELDAIIDLLVVIIGYGLSSGYAMQGAWDEVMRSNMDKINPVTGMVTKRADGKVMKPDYWNPPNLEPFLQAGFESRSAPAGQVVDGS